MPNILPDAGKGGLGLFLRRKTWPFYFLAAPPISPNTETLGSLLDPAPYDCTRAARASMRDEADWVWSVSSILSVLLAGLES